MKKRTMFCLPFAGGTKTDFNEFRERFGEVVEVVPLEYSGHGTRFSSPLITSFTQIVNDICRQIRSTCCCDYIIVGHSLGTAVAYEVAYKMTKNYMNPPHKLILMAQKPPHLQKESTVFIGKSKEEVMKTIYDYGHMPKEIITQKDLYNIYSEIIYADICALNSYSPEVPREKIDVPFKIFSGESDDGANIKHMSQWSNYTSQAMELFEIKGGHFFPFEQNKEFFSIMQSIL